MAILGAGISGALAALHLAEAGADVVVLDRGSSLGSVEILLLPLYLSEDVSKGLPNIFITFCLTLR